MRTRIAPLLVLLLLLAAACADPEPASEVPANPVPPTPANPVPETPTSSAAAARLDLNTATGADFQAAMPDLSDRMVHEFEEYRPYVSIQQFRREMAKYVDEDQIAAYERYVYVPIDYNESDAETLQQIPGVDATEAEALVAARPYASRAAFLDALAAYAAPDEVATGAAYLVAP